MKDVIARIKQNGLKGADSQIDIAILWATLSLECFFRHELNLSTINPPSNRMQMTSEVVEIRDQNLYGPESYSDCINMGGNMRSFALHQGGDHILSGPGRIADRDRIGKMFMIIFVMRIIIETRMVIILHEII